MKFKKGDKVNVYGWIRNSSLKSVYSLGPYCRGFRAKVISQYAYDEVLVEFTTGNRIEVHPKQCRKVKAKRRAANRR